MWPGAEKRGQTKDGKAKDRTGGRSIHLTASVVEECKFKLHIPGIVPQQSCSKNFVESGAQDDKVWLPVRCSSSSGMHYPCPIRFTLHIPAGPIWDSLYVRPFRVLPFLFVNPVATHSEKHSFDVGWHAESDDVSGFLTFFVLFLTPALRDRYRFLLKTCKLLLTGRKVG